MQNCIIPINLWYLNSNICEKLIEIYVSDQSVNLHF